MKQMLLLLVCVLGISVGQILFKHSANSLGKNSSLLRLFLFPPFIIAIIIYSITTIVWVYALIEIKLNQAYPFMALAFVFVPFFSWLIFRESMSLRYAIGIALICTGILLTARSC